MLKKNLVSFEPTAFSQKLTLYLPKTNSHSNRFFFELDTTKLTLTAEVVLESKSKIRKVFQVLLPALFGQNRMTRLLENTISLNVKGVVG